MWPADEHSWEHAVGSDHRHQPVGSESERERRTHPVAALPVSVSERAGAEQHELPSEHGEDRRPAGQPAGVGQQLNSFLLTFIHNLSLLSFRNSCKNVDKMVKILSVDKHMQ